MRLPYEAIVVDDGSDDGTPEAVRDSFPDARLVVQPVNQGLVAGRNAALPFVRGRLVLMLDADTEVRPGAVETLAGVLDAQPQVGLVGPKLIGPDGELQLSCRRYPPLLIPFMRRGPYARLNPDPAVHRRHLMKDFDHTTERPVVWVSGAVQMWRADLPSKIGNYDRWVVLVWWRGPRLVPACVGSGPRGPLRPAGRDPARLAADDAPQPLRSQELACIPRLVLPAVEAQEAAPESAPRGGEPVRAP